MAHPKLTRLFRIDVNQTRARQESDKLNRVDIEQRFLFYFPTGPGFESFQRMRIEFATGKHKSFPVTRVTHNDSLPVVFSIETDSSRYKRQEANIPRNVQAVISVLTTRVSTVDHFQQREFCFGSGEAALFLDNFVRLLDGAELFGCNRLKLFRLPAGPEGIRMVFLH